MREFERYQYVLAVLAIVLQQLSISRQIYYPFPSMVRVLIRLVGRGRSSDDPHVVFRHHCPVHTLTCTMSANERMNPRYSRRLPLCLAGLSCCASLKLHYTGQAFPLSPMAMTTQPRIANYHPYHVPSINTHRRHRTRQLLSSAVSNESSIEPRTIHEVTIELPLGVVLEDMDPSSLSSSTVTAPSGVTIICIHENGNAAIYNANIFSKLKSLPTENTYNISCRNDCICIRDKIMSINGLPCHDMGLDDVINLIFKSATNNSRNNKITIGLGRLTKSTVVNYHWNRHICQAWRVLWILGSKMWN